MRRWNMWCFFGTLALGIAIGIGIDVVWTDDYSTFVTTQPLVLRFRGVDEIGVIPSGTPLLGEDPLLNNPELGWVACVPVAFATQAQAISGGIEEAPFLDIWDTPLTAD